jgi:hypothetical protein
LIFHPADPRQLSKALFVLWSRRALSFVLPLPPPRSSTLFIIQRFHEYFIWGLCFLRSCLEVTNFYAPSWGNVNDTFPCWSLLWATANQHPPTHHPSTGCRLFLRCEWTSNWVNIWLHLSNQFCRK